MSMSRAQVVIDTKFQNAFFREIEGVQGPIMGRYSLRKTSCYIFLSELQFFP